jgi:hypothetical protein
MAYPNLLGTKRLGCCCIIKILQWLTKMPTITWKNKFWQFCLAMSICLCIHKNTTFSRFLAWLICFDFICCGNRALVIYVSILLSRSYWTTHVSLTKVGHWKDVTLPGDLTEGSFRQECDNGPTWKWP